MALRGGIADFGLADILQLIINGNRAGFIHLKNQYDEVRLGIDQGWILSADARLRQTEAQFANRLCRAGAITQEQLRGLLAAGGGSGQSVADQVIALGILDAQTVSQHATLAATDLILELFTWSSGEYEFQDGLEVPQARHVEPIAADFLLMQGLRLVEEWPKICARIPSYGYRVSEALPLPAETTVRTEDLFSHTLDMPMEEMSELRLEIGDNERAVHALCVPGAKVQSIIDLMRLSRFETCRCISTLIEGGFLRLAAPS